jgi:hypothetical protein
MSVSAIVNAAEIVSRSRISIKTTSGSSQNAAQGNMPESESEPILLRYNRVFGLKRILSGLHRQYDKLLSIDVIQNRSQSG